jgi:hypothetical protein
MGHSILPRSLSLRSFVCMTLAIFALSLFQPSLQVWAMGSGHFDGPGGFIDNQFAMQRYNNDMNFIRYQISEENDVMNQHRKIVGMTLGAAVGGGLVAMLGLAASPILAATAVLGAMATGGFIGSKLARDSRNPFEEADRHSNFLTWAGGLAGGMLGFIIPGGSVIGATLGAAAGGMAGNYFGEKKERTIQRRYGGMMFGPGAYLGGAFDRFSGAFGGPVGALASGPEYRSRLLGGAGFPWASPGWFSGGGQFSPGYGGMGMAGDGPIDSPQYQVWHDNNGELAYPGWENDLFTLDGNGRLDRTLPEWTLGGEQGMAGYSGGSSIERPNWETSEAARSGAGSNAFRRRGASAVLTSDGEAFNPMFETGSDENLVDISLRYRDAVEELRNLTLQSAPALQRQRAHQEVQRLERQLQQRLKQ